MLIAVGTRSDMRLTLQVLLPSSGADFHVPGSFDDQITEPSASPLKRFAAHATFTHTRQQDSSLSPSPTVRELLLGSMQGCIDLADALHASEHGACPQVAAALRGSEANLRVAQEAGGFRRITQLLQWAALTFPVAGSSQSAADAVPSCGSSPPPSPLHPTQELPGLKARSLPAPKELSSPYPSSPRLLLQPRPSGECSSSASEQGGEGASAAALPVAPDSRRQSWSSGAQQAIEAARSSGSLTPPVPPWAAPSARFGSSGEHPGTQRVPERRATDGPELPRSPIWRSASGGGSMLKRMLLHADGSGSSDWRSSLLRRGSGQSASAQVEGDAGSSGLDARPMGSLAQAGLPGLPSPALTEAFAVLEAWLDLAERRPGGSNRTHWDRCPCFECLSSPVRPCERSAHRYLQ